MLELDKEKIYSLGYIVCMPDFYIDRIIKLDSLDILSFYLYKKLEYGGSIRDVRQFETKGGNATNLVYALARLGSKCILITVADEYGKNILEHTFKDLEVTLIIKRGKQGYTTAFELHDNINIMISDDGSNASFGFDMVVDCLDTIRSARAVAITNWASNKYGNELVEGVFSLTKALRFIDPADISEKGYEFVNMVKKFNHLIDVVSINENEANVIAKVLNINSKTDLSYKIARELNVRIDLHTVSYSSTSDGKDTKVVKTFKVDPKVVTGAGDVWNAADIIGYLTNLSDVNRLLFANATAALYVKDGYAPTLNDVIKFIEVQ